MSAAAAGPREVGGLNLGGVDVRIIVDGQFGSSAAEPMLKAAVADLLARGLLSSDSTNWDDPVIYALAGVEVVGAIAFNYSKWTRSVGISLGATAATWRRRGVYRALWAALVDYTRAEHPGAVEIRSGYHIDNAPSAAMQAALGRRVTGITTAFKL